MIIESFKITLTCDECSRTSEYSTHDRAATMEVAQRAGWHISYAKDLCKTCKEKTL